MTIQYTNDYSILLDLDICITIRKLLCDRFFLLCFYKIIMLFSLSLCPLLEQHKHFAIDLGLLSLLFL